MNDITFNKLLDETRTQMRSRGKSAKYFIEIIADVVNTVHKLINARIAKGLTCNQLANMSNINISRIIDIETLKIVPTLEDVVKISKVLGLKVGSVAKGQDVDEIKVQGKCPKCHSNNTMTGFRKDNYIYCNCSNCGADFKSIISNPNIITKDYRIEFAGDSPDAENQKEDNK